MEIISDKALDVIFRNARTHTAWQDKPVSGVVLEALYDLMRLGPTSANCCPARVVFVTTDEARERLKPCLIASNVEQTMTAPVTAILAYDTRFYERLPELFPHQPEARSWFDGDPAKAERAAFQSGTLQGAYLIIAARSVGLDCGPMGGFDNALVDATFFPDSSIKSNFLCNLGYGDPSRLHPRLPRLAFDDACQIV